MVLVLSLQEELWIGLDQACEGNCILAVATGLKASVGH